MSIDLDKPSREADEMAEGYRDGYDLDSPEPSANRTASYRHGFECGRSDRAGKPAFGSAAEARRLASIAENTDLKARGIE